MSGLTLLDLSCFNAPHASGKVRSFVSRSSQIPCSSRRRLEASIVMEDEGANGGPIIALLVSDARNRNRDTGEESVAR